MNPNPHTSVLVHEWLTLLEGRQLHVYVDGTLGAGGHGEAVLKAHPEIERFIGIDQDPDALAIAQERLLPWKEKVTFKYDNFLNLETIVQEERLPLLDAMLLDLGVSSMQLDRPLRGFSFQQEGPLDMRMNPRAPLKALDIVNDWEEKEIARIFRDYGEEKEWKRAARVIVREREKQPIQSTKELVEVLMPIFRSYKKTGSHPLTLIFQALRIAVNSELEVLRAVLPQMVHHLKPGGVMGIITFHSLEDRIVKHFFQEEASNKQHTSGLAGLFLEKEPRLRLLTKKALRPGEEELKNNPRSRSAKLRGAERR